MANARSNNKSWTVSVGSAALRQKDEDDDDLGGMAMAARKKQRSRSQGRQNRIHTFFVLPVLLLFAAVVLSFFACFLAISLNAR